MPGLWGGAGSVQGQREDVDHPLCGPLWASERERPAPTDAEGWRGDAAGLRVAAVAWIQFEPGVFDHRKTLRLSVQLGLRETHLAGHLARLWTWALSSAPSGDLGDLEPAVIARAADWTGDLLDVADAETFVGALLTVGFLDRLDDGGLRLHGWRERHTLWAERRESEQRTVERSEADRRKRHAESQAGYRARKRGDQAGDRGVIDGDITRDGVGDQRVIDGDITRDQRVIGGDRGVMSRVIDGDITRGAPDRTGPEPETGANRTRVTPPAPRKRGERASEGGRGAGMVAGAPPAPLLLDVDPEAARVWTMALAELRLGMSEANYRSHLGETVGASFEGGQLTVAVSNPLVRETLDQRFRQHIARAVFDVVGHECRVQLVTGRARAPTLALVASTVGSVSENGHAEHGSAEQLEDVGNG